MNWGLLSMLFRSFWQDFPSLAAPLMPPIAPVVPFPKEPQTTGPLKMAMSPSETRSVRAWALGQPRQTRAELVQTISVTS